MASIVDYLASDWDERAHKGARRLDLQDLDLPDASLDVVLTSHVLEHVPDTRRALAELHRVLAPGGVAYIMVPLAQARTAPPTSPEYHGDETLVYWRFGWDLADMVREAGFATTTLATSDLVRRALEDESWGYVGLDVDSEAVLAGARERLQELTVVADERTSLRLGFVPSYFFVVWEAGR